MGVKVTTQFYPKGSRGNPEESKSSEYCEDYGFLECDAV
jgi:hypothetical protein